MLQQLLYIGKQSNKCDFFIVLKLICSETLKKSKTISDKKYPEKKVYKNNNEMYQTSLRGGLNKCSSRVISY